MKVSDLKKTNEFEEKRMNKFMIHDSPWFRIINFNLPAGVTFPVHSHELEGQLSIQVIEGEGFFLGAEGAEIPTSQGEILVCDIAVPHGVKAKTDMRILVTIAPPI